MFTLTLCTVLISIAHANDVTPMVYPRGLIYGGKSIDIKEVPYLVTLNEHTAGEKSIEHLCSGLLISTYHILTTAHCVTNAKPAYLRDLYVTVNSSLYSNRILDTNLRLDNREIHPQYYTNKHGLPVNDLAVLKFSKDSERFIIDSQLTLASAELINESEDISAGIDALVTGWARFNGSHEEHLTARIVQTLDTSLCKKAYDNVGGLSAGQICASYPGADGKDGCMGDRGAPLVIGGRVAGILSWGNGCIEARYPGVYTNIAYYRDWIYRTMKIL